MEVEHASLIDYAITGQTITTEKTLVIPTNARNIDVSNNVFLAKFTIYIYKASRTVRISENQFQGECYVEILHAPPNIHITGNTFDGFTSISLPPYSAANIHHNNFFYHKFIQICESYQSEVPFKYALGNEVSYNNFHHSVDIRAVAIASKSMEVAYELVAPHELWLRPRGGALALANKMSSVEFVAPQPPPAPPLVSSSGGSGDHISHQQIQQQQQQFSKQHGKYNSRRESDTIANDDIPSITRSNVTQHSANNNVHRNVQTVVTTTLEPASSLAQRSSVLAGGDGGVDGADDDNDDDDSEDDAMEDDEIEVESVKINNSGDTVSTHSITSSKKTHHKLSRKEEQARRQATALSLQVINRFPYLNLQLGDMSELRSVFNDKRADAAANIPKSVSVTHTSTTNSKSKRKGSISGRGVKAGGGFKNRLTEAVTDGAVLESGNESHSSHSKNFPVIVDEDMPIVRSIEATAETVDDPAAADIFYTKNHRVDFGAPAYEKYFESENTGSNINNPFYSTLNNNFNSRRAGELRPGYSRFK